MKRRLWLGASASVLASSLVVAIGCGSERDPVVLRVGPEEVRLGQFEERFWAASGGAADSRGARADTAAAGGRVRPDTAGVRRFADQVTEELLLGLLAKKHEPELEPARLERIDEFKEQNMVAALRKRRYGDVLPSEKDLRKSWELMARRLQLRLMVLGSDREAHDIRAQLAEGAVFTKVAEARSLDLSSRDRGGELGWISYLDLDPTVRDDVFALDRGEVSAPLLAGRFYHLYQVVDEQANEGRGTFEEERARLEFGVRAALGRKAQQAYHADLFRKYNFKMDPAEVAWVTVLMREKTKSVDRGEKLASGEATEEDMRRLQSAPIPWTGLPFALADTARVLATFDPPDGVVSPMLFVDQLLTHAIPTWPRFDSSRDAEELIRELVLERLEIREAREHKFDQSPEYLASVGGRIEDARVRQFRRRRVVETPEPTEAELRAAFQKRLSEYSTPERRRFQAIGSADLATAAEISRLLRAGESVAAIEARFAARDTSFQSTGEAGTPPFLRGQSPMLDEVLFALPTGGVSDPIDIGGRYTVARVLEIVPYEERSFESVREELVNKVRAELAEVRLRQMMVEARQEFPVQVDEAALQRVRLRRPSS